MRRHRLASRAARVLVGSAVVLGLAVTVDVDATGAVGRASLGAGARAPLGAVSLGALPSGTEFRIDVELQPRNPAALERLAAEVSTPGDTAYGHFLDRGQFAARFGPTAHALDTVRGWLSRSGLAVAAVSANHLTIQARGDSTDVEHAFGTTIDRYRLAGGRIAFAAASTPTAPASARPFLEGVFGLDDVVLPTSGSAPSPTGPAGPAGSARGAARVQAAASGPQPCTAAAQAASSRRIYTANELASAYDFAGLYGEGDEGSGLTIGMFELGPDLPSDISAYQACFGTHSTVTYDKIDGGSGTGDGNGEAALDIETAIGLAPDANIDVYQAPRSETGIIDNFTAMVDDDTSKVLSTSWGSCESKNGATLIAAEGNLFEQAAVQGQSVVAATGDDGASDCGTAALAVDDPASQPYVTGVGGTTLHAIGPPPTETAWDESAIREGAGGGGVSAVQVMPSYQASAPASLHVVNADSSGATCKAPAGEHCREVPDVSADADWTTGYLIYWDGKWYGDGGTSAATPLWAALFALADASSACAGRTVGFANPALYDAAASTYAADFNDVTSGDNDYTPDGNKDGLYPATEGYDMATGLGTPIAASLVGSLCAIRSTASVTTTTSLRDSKGTVRYGSEGKETFSVTVTGRAGDGRPLGRFKVYNGGRVLCSAALKASTTTKSVGSCHLTPKEIKPGEHGEIFARFVPAISSSTAPKIHYAVSSSWPWKIVEVEKA